MQIMIKNQLLELNSTEVKLAKKHFSEYLKKTRALSTESGRPSYYYTFLIICYVMSQDLLDMCEAEMLVKFLKAVNRKQESDKEIIT